MPGKVHQFISACSNDLVKSLFLNGNRLLKVQFCLDFNGALLTAYLFLLTPIATARKRNELTRGTSMERVDSELVKRLIDCAGK